jgi:uncharacterized protein (DUF2141 family)
MCQARGGGNSIRAEIGGLRSAKGEVRCLLFQGGDGFPNHASKAAQSARWRRSGTERAVCEFPDPPAATLAIAFIHDEYGNGVLDKNFFGVPVEGLWVLERCSGLDGTAGLRECRIPA